MQIPTRLNMVGIFKSAVTGWQQLCYRFHDRLEFWRTKRMKYSEVMHANKKFDGKACGRGFSAIRCGSRTMPEIG